MNTPSPLEQVKYEFVRYTRGDGLDIGRGKDKAFPHFIAVRLANDMECENAKVREIVVDDLCALEEVDDGKCDFILAADCLRNPEPEFTLYNWLRCIRDGGHLCVFEPDREVFGHDDMMRAVNRQKTPVDVVRFEDWPAGGTLLVLRKGEAGLSYQKPKPEKSVCIVRHGGYGDQIQAASLFPELKRQGYRVTVLTTESGRDILKHDPHVDDWYLIDKGQIPNSELVWFWKITARHYDKFVNLNESVEGTFLAMPNRVQHSWPQAVRHARLNVNYSEHAAALAEIPFKPEGRFYPSDEENQRASEHFAKIREDMSKGLVIGEASHPVFNILWVLSGSSPHKFSPHQDVVIQSILKRLPRATVTLVGDDACRILEAGWETTERIYCRSGELSIRDSLTLALNMDLVVGPETGIMNAVAYEPMKKVVLLSHSSHENLTKHWRNTAVIEGKSFCYPCHQLHYTAEFCPTEPKTGAALCQAGVHPQSIYGEIDAEYTGWARVKMLVAA